MKGKYGMVGILIGLTLVAVVFVGCGGGRSFQGPWGPPVVMKPVVPPIVVPYRSPYYPKWIPNWMRPCIQDRKAIY